MKVVLERIRPFLCAALLALAAASVEGRPPARPPSATADEAARAQSSKTPSTLAQYRARVRDAVAPVEELAAFCETLSRGEKPEVWSREDFDPDVALQFPKREKEAFDKVRALLPPRERVEWTGGALEVDNSWLYAAIQDFESQRDNDKRALSLHATAGRLRALGSRLAELEGGRHSTDVDAERGRLAAIMRDPDFNRASQQQKDSVLRRDIESFVEWLRDLFGRFFRSLFGGMKIKPGTNPLASQIMQVVVVAVCVAVIAYFAWFFWSRRTRATKGPKLKRKARVILGERVEADQTSADLLEDAERLARAGDLRGAMRKAYVALLCELGDRQVVRLARHKTNRDYLNAVRRSDRARLYTEMLPLTSEFELHWYGLREAVETDWDDFRARCRRAIRQSGV